MKRVVSGVAMAALTLLALAHPAAAEEQKPAEHKPSLKEMVAAHAKNNGVPESLVHRVILRESRYNPRAVGAGGAMGLMQIKHGTARALGYKGSASGLLDADTNLTYAVRYLAGAYRAANGNADRAASFYRTGYYRSKRASAPVLASAKSVPAKLTPSKPARLDADATTTRTDGRATAPQN
jgi:soluble lytic murein transglycosylase-like protein